VDLDPTFKLDRQMAAVVLGAPDPPVAGGEGSRRQDGDAVVALLTEYHLMRVAHGGDRLRREIGVLDLGLLEAEGVGPMGGEEALEMGQALADGVDVPGGEAEGHDEAIISLPMRAHSCCGGARIMTMTLPSCNDRPDSVP
jgi:hypothetical protein